MGRIALVRDVKIDGLSAASVFHAGDSVTIKPRDYVLAVQREVAVFWEDEGGFSNYPIFWEPIPKVPEDREVRMIRCNDSPFIRVDAIQVLAVASSSVVQLGNSCRIDAETRVLNIRQLLRGKRPVGGAGAPETEEAQRI